MALPDSWSFLWKTLDAIGHGIPREDARIAEPLLIGFLRDTNNWVCSSASMALKQIDPEVAEKACVK
jgi:hypothetical protein